MSNSLFLVSKIYELLYHIDMQTVDTPHKYKKLIPATYTTHITLEKDKIYSSVYRIYSLFEFLGLHKKCTIVIVNYGASEDFYNELSNFYKNYSFIKIVDSCDLQDKLF